MTAVKTISHDVIVVGAGPGGSTLAALLANQGIDVAIIEKEEFPRFKVGESLLPYSVDILKKSGAFPKVDSGQFIRKYGAQFIDHNDFDEVYFEFLHGLDDQHPYSFQVERARFDQVLLKHAVSAGAQLYQPETVKKIFEHKECLEVHTDKQIYQAKYVVDASGRSALLGQQFKSRTRNVGFNNVAVFSHFENIPRHEGRRAGDIII